MIVFYSERDGNAEIYVMNPDGSDQRLLTKNNADDFSPSWSPDGRLIVFESDRDDPHPRTCFPNCNYNLYLMNADGSDPRQLTALPGAEWHASWSPDGKSLVFTAGSLGFEKAGIYRVSVDGSEPQPLLVDDFRNGAPDWSPDGAQIAFSSNRDGNLDIFVMNADGGDIRKVVDTGIDDYSPEWSPNGAQIAFFATDWPTVRQDIFTVNADGSNLLNLTNTPEVVDEEPHWSPDGSRIIFQSDRDGNFEIYVMNPDGSQPQNLTRHPGRDYWPDWFMLPETKIAFVSDHSGRPQIYLMPAPGAQILEVVDVSDLQPLTNERYDHYFPSWSPDGTQIAYYTHFSWQSWAIMVMDADGSNPRQLTASNGETICSFGPVWSPDGQQIAFTIEPNPRPTCEMKHTEIAVINTDGSGFKILTQNEANDLAGSWSPDGSQLIFSSNRDGNNEIYVMDADGSNPQRLTEPGSTNSMPALSPDGRSIAFVSDRDGNDEIYLMDADGSNPRRLTNNPASDWQPSWSPDGTQIVFTSGSPSGGFDISVMDVDGTGLRQLTDDPGWEFEPVWQPLETSTLSPTSLPGQQVAFQTEDGLSRSAQILPTPVPPTPTNVEDAPPPLQVVTTANAKDVVLLRTLQIPGFSQSAISQCSVAFSPDGRLLSGVCYQNTLPIWDVQSGELLFSLEPSPLHHVAVAFSPDGKRIATGGFSKRIGLWDTATGELLRTTSALPSPIWDLAFSPQGDRLASANLSLDFSQVPGLHLWNVSDGELLWSYGGEGKASPLVLSVDYDPTGKTIACGTFDSITIMDAQTGEPIRTLPIPNHVGDTAFSPDGQLLAAGSDDDKIRLWRIADYELLATLEGHAHYVNGVAFGPDGSFLVSGSHDKKVGIWDVQNSQLLKLLEGHEAAVLRVDVNPSGTLIASISWDGTVRLWGVIE